MWSKIKAFFSNFASLIISALLLIAIVIAGIIIATRDDNKDEGSKPEIAQVFEPSISTPLPPDVVEEPAKTEVASNEQGQVAGDSTPQTNFVAPAAGIDDDAPIPYQNSDHGLSITLPAHTNISEQNNLLTFGNLFSVNIVASSETLQQISAELSQSPEVKNIQSTTFAGKQALKFTVNNNTGYVITKNNKAYYLIGQDKYLTQVKI